MTGYTLECTIHYEHEGDSYRIHLTKSNDADKTQTWSLHRMETRYNDTSNWDWVLVDDVKLFNELIDLIDD